MRTTSTLLGLLALLLTVGLQAQTRYVDAQFDVQAPVTDTFATNISILTGTPVPQDLTIDFYLPEADTTTEDRPVVVIFPTGNFLPAYINQGLYGNKNDSVNVYLANQLASLGYVAAVAEYRTGWLPTASDQVTRTETLLRAAYRGGQDANAVARFLRATVAEEDNQYGIDTSRIVFWGIGTGGYVTMTHAFLDSISEIALNAQFYDNDGNLLIDEARDGSPDGTVAGLLNTVNTPDYNSNVALSINTGGALGDPEWIQSGPNSTDAVLGYHSASNPFAPFVTGTVIVPTTQQAVVSGVAGSNFIVNAANQAGINDELAAANMTDLPDVFSELSEAVNTLNEAYKQVTLAPGVQLSHDNMFPFVYPGDTVSGPYNWADEQTARFIVGQINTSGVANLDADAILANERRFNPNFDDPAAAKRTIDTMLAHFIPHAAYALNFDFLSSSNENIVDRADVGLEVFPNPASNVVSLQTAAGFPVRDVRVFTFMGRMVQEFREVNATNYRLDLGNLPRGNYFLQLGFDEGTTTQKLILR